MPGTARRGPALSPPRVSVPPKDPCPNCPHTWHGFRCGVSNTNLCACRTSISEEMQAAEREALAGVNAGGIPAKAGHDGAEPSA